VYYRDSATRGRLELERGISISGVVRQWLAAARYHVKV